MEPPGPPKILEFLVAILLPSAARQEVLGDLYERFQSLPRYLLDVLETVPFVIFSRIRRTSDPQITTIQAFALYASFLAAAWFNDPAVLHARLGFLRLAIPTAASLLGLTLSDAYAVRRPPSALTLSRAMLLAVFAMAIFQICRRP